MCARAYRNGGASVNAGWYRVQRQMLDHPIVGAGSLGKYSRFEAWHWLIKNAVYEERKIKNRGQEITLQPGELLAAYAYLATSWNWTIDAVRWFLVKLETAKAITKRTDKHTNHAQVIRLVNWQIYQMAHQETHTGTHHGTHQHLNNKQETIPGDYARDPGFWKRAIGGERGLTAAPSTGKDQNKNDVENDQHTAEFENGVLVVNDKMRDHWLPAFGGDRQRFDWALQEVAGFIDLFGVRPLAAQVNSLLARKAGDKRDRDQRYAAAVKTNNAGSAPFRRGEQIAGSAGRAQNVGHVSRVVLRDQSEPFETYRTRMIAEGKLEDKP